MSMRRDPLSCPLPPSLLPRQPKSWLMKERPLTQFIPLGPQMDQTDTTALLC